MSRCFRLVSSDENWAASHRASHVHLYKHGITMEIAPLPVFDAMLKGDMSWNFRFAYSQSLIDFCTSNGMEIR